MDACDNPLNRDGLCVLSLDGGGVRGLSSLLVLKALMAKVNAERRKDNQPAVKPCELFDLIGGTSTGGIIAIMLGRLEMDVDDCIKAYTRMFEAIFSKKNLPITIWGKIKGRFKSSVLEECVSKILKDHGLSGAEPLNDGKQRCKVFVCAKAFEITKTVLLRSYQSDDALNNIPASISEAVRATSAATSFFDPVVIGPQGRKFVDGALGANNPVEQLWNEAQTMWCHGEIADLNNILKCFVSIGTGDPGTKPISEGPLKFFSDTLVGIATQTDDTARIFVERHRRLFENKRYFRFNVQQGLQGVGLEEFKNAALIDAATADYMDRQETKSAAHACASNLKQKQFVLEFSPKAIIEWEKSRNIPAKISRQEPIGIIPFEKNDGFVERDDIFEKLDQLLIHSSRNRSVAIWGLGGCGKTQIALEYAYRCRDKNSSPIFWVHANSEARFTQDYSHLATKLKLPQELKGPNLLLAVKEWLEQQKNWLLVLDNADDLSIFKSTYSSSQDPELKKPDLLQFVPKARTGSVIWTSRDGAILGSIVDLPRGVEVGAMSDQQACDLFQKLCGIPLINKPVQEEEELLDLLHRLPLAISQAAAYIRKTKVSVKRYLKLFTESESRQSNLLSHEFQDPYRSEVPNSVMRTWQISMAQIAKESPCAERILNTISFLDAKGLPFQLLNLAASNENEEPDEDRTLVAAGRLIEYSFLQSQKSDDEGLPSYEQHRLVQLATRRSITDPDKIGFFSGLALKIMASSFPNGRFETWDDCRKYLPHALKAIACLEAREYKKITPNLAEKIATYYGEQGQFNEAEKLEIEVLELRKEVLGTKHPKTITAMGNLASTWGQLGRLNEAEKLKLEVLELRKEVLGTKHPSTITAMGNLATSWGQLGKLNEAEKLEVEVLELQKEVLGTRHPETIGAMGNLASTWWQLGRLNEAEKLEVEVLELQKEVLGTKHPDIIRAMGNLASNWLQLGRLNEAEELELEALELRKEVLGIKHPDTIRTMGNLASIWWQLGKLNEAEQLELEVLELQKEVSGTKHPDTITAMGNLAATWRQLGRLNEAEQLEIEVLRLQKEVLGTRHPDTITAMGNLAATWWQLGKLNEAEQLELEVLKLQKEVLGTKHPDTIGAMGNLAATWRQLDRLNEAEKLEIEVLELQKEVLGTRHPDTILAMKSLAASWWQLGRLNEAEQLEIEVLELQKDILGPEHPDTISAMENLALTWRNQDRLKEAENLEAEALALQKKAKGVDQSDIL
ncbi:MAG: hypothetical protein M1829_003864 [Trizodia sp. TS-e1964]|nr:MAG: hypothetical protein M1829_003864 [Trizodia sp. TS-e1964]